MYNLAMSTYLVRRSMTSKFFYMKIEIQKTNKKRAYRVLVLLPIFQFNTIAYVLIYWQYPHGWLLYCHLQMIWRCQGHPYGFEYASNGFNMFSIFVLSFIMLYNTWIVLKSKGAHIKQITDEMLLKCVLYLLIN